MFCAGRVDKADMERLTAACGGSILTTVSQIDKDVLGSCSEFYEQQVGSERCDDCDLFFFFFFVWSDLIAVGCLESV